MPQETPVNRAGTSAEEPRTFAWGQSVGMNGANRIIDIPVNDGHDWIGSIELGLDDARVLHNMLGDVLNEAGGAK